MAIAKGGQTTKRDLLPAASSLKQSRALFWHSVMKACDRGRTWEAAALIKSKKSSQGRKEGRPEKFPPTDPGSQEYSSTCSSCKQMLFVMLHLQPFFPPGRGLPLPVTGGPNLLATAKSVDPSKEQSGI